MLEQRIGHVIDRQELLGLPVDSDVAGAARVMAAQHVGAMLVYDGEEVCGLFTDRDLLERVVAAGLRPEETALREVMTPEPAEIGPETSLLETILAMKQHRTRYVLVKDAGRVTGIVAMRDLLRFFVDVSLAEHRHALDLWQGFPV